MLHIQKLTLVTSFPVLKKVTFQECKWLPGSSPQMPHLPFCSSTPQCSADKTENYLWSCQPGLLTREVTAGAHNMQTRWHGYMPLYFQKKKKPAINTIHKPMHSQSRHTHMPSKQCYMKATLKFCDC